MTRFPHSDGPPDLKATLRSERGSVLIMVGVALLGIGAIVAIAIDSAMMLTTHNQLQTAADAAALAGASGLIEGDESLAIERAVAIAGLNEAVQNASPAPVVITEDDVEFPEAGMVRVTVHRTAATGDPLRLFFRKLAVIDAVNEADLTASAAAQAFDVCAGRCLRPWAIPDRWADEDGDQVYDDSEVYDPETTGYIAPNDVGALITLKVGNPQQAVTPGIFYPVDYPPLDSGQGAPLTGGDWYREWISVCCPYTVGVGDKLQLEPGNMVGPTSQGMDELMALDPSAQWDGSSQSIINSAWARSPRIALVPFFDPTLPPVSGRNYVTVTKIGAFFIENLGPGGEVTGRFVDTSAVGAPCAGGGLGSSLVKGLTLVE